MFYSGKAYSFKVKAKQHPRGKAIKQGLIQECSDLIFARHSAFSYEDLTSDKYGAIFGAEYFDPNSSYTLGEQLLHFLESLGATDPQNAPNYETMPETDSKNPPSEKNYSSHPIFSDNQTNNNQEEHVKNK
ncbi:MAG: hypothetical protein MJY84_07000 [Bacteroidales bacterium]|nr:hypothetical protein [Bacteroidales bacterium]